MNCCSPHLFVNVNWLPPPLLPRPHPCSLAPTPASIHVHPRIDLAFYERAQEDLVRAELALTTAMDIMPSSHLLAFAAADFYELSRHSEV